MPTEEKQVVQATFALGKVGFKAKIISIIWKDKNICL